MKEISLPKEVRHLPSFSSISNVLHTGSGLGWAYMKWEFHITNHLLCYALGGGAKNTVPHVLYMGISYSC